MSLDHATVQTLRSHGAAIDRAAYQLADRFLDAFFAACPHLRGRFTAPHNRQRRQFAQSWAWFIRNLSRSDQVSAAASALGAWLGSRGLNFDDFRTVRSCLLEATRETCAECSVPYMPQHEAAWAAAFDQWLNIVSPAMPAMYAQAA